MKEHSVEGIIYAVDELNIKYAVCYIKQIYYEDKTIKYIFKPYYQIIDMLNPSFFQGIPGLNLDLRKKEYIRENRTPTFIYERTPQENREDLWELLEEVNLNYLDKLEWLIRTDKIYTGDSLIVERFNEPKLKNNVKDLVIKDNIVVDSINVLGRDTYEVIRNLLKIITYGAFLKTKDFEVNDKNRTNLYALIYTLYRNEYKKLKKRQRDGIEKAKSKNVYRGRKKIEVSLPKLNEVVEYMKAKKMTEQEAMEVLGLHSRSTLYRRIRDYKNNNL